MRISFSALFLILVFDTLSSGLQGGERRLGKLETQSWDTHYALGQNLSPYEESALIPSFSSVGALLSNDGVLGTASLIAPDTIITAAHVVKNRTSDPSPNPSQWKFILFHDFELAPSNLEYKIKSFSVHPTWIERQQLKPPFGDGDRLGCDLAIAKLESSVIGYQPLRLPGMDGFSIGEKVYLAGFGNLVDGKGGSGNSDNSRRMAGENILDRIVTEVSIIDSVKGGGLLAFDFDSPSRNNNSLGINSSQTAFDNLPSGDSSESPLTLEVSTAEGDSGGPLIAKQNKRWRLLGTVSYGSSNSTYGDISVLTRLSNHTDWIQKQLPYWPEAMLLNDQGWVESDWLGLMMPFSSGWNYTINLGWVWSKPKSDDSVWLYKNHLGWLWTNLSIYPFFHSNEMKDWLFLDLESSNGISWYLYNFSSKKWKHFNL